VATISYRAKRNAPVTALYSLLAAATVWLSAHALHWPTELARRALTTLLADDLIGGHLFGSSCYDTIVQA